MAGARLAAHLRLSSPRPLGTEALGALWRRGTKRSPTPENFFALASGFSTTSASPASSASAWVPPGSTVYANPLCSQLDQMLLRCEDTESVLALLVTHRGVFFVHNLVTVMQVLGSLAHEANDPIAVNALLRDSRFDLLLRDILRFVPKFDFLAMTNIACSLWQLGYKHYVLMTRMIGPLLQHVVPDVGTLLRCAQAYAWAGYATQADLYNRCARELAAAAGTLPPHDLAAACALFGGVAHYHRLFFDAAEEAIVERQLLVAPGESSSAQLMCPADVVLVARGFASHARATHDELFQCLAVFLQREAASMELRDLSRCLGAFVRVGLCYEGAIQAALAACALPLERAWLLRQPLAVDSALTAEVATLLECSAYFGVETTLTRRALEYLFDHVDEVDESSAIKVVYSLSAMGQTDMLPTLMLLLFRKIGAGTAWEADRLRVFHLFFCQLLQFPWLDARLPRRCLDAGLRAWCLHRRGHGCPFPSETATLAKELLDMGVKCRALVAVPGTPYEVDVVIGDGKDCLLILSENARNTLTPVGGALLQVRHLQARGWRCVVVPRDAWLALTKSSANSESRRGYLRTVLLAFATNGQPNVCAGAAAILPPFALRLPEK